MAVNHRSYRELSFKDTDKIDVAVLSNFIGPAMSSDVPAQVSVDVSRIEHDRYPGQFDTTITLSIEESR